MNFSIVVPKKKINKGKRSGGGSDFWKKFWTEQITDENREQYSRMFSRRIRQIDTTVKKIKTEAKVPEQLLYIEVKLDDLANSKSNSPNGVWTETGLEIVGAKDEKTLIVSGKSEDFDRLTEIGSSGSFKSALTGEGLSTRKDKNLLRELYAMSAVKDRNAVVEGRVSNYIYSLIHNDVLDEPIETIVEIYPNIGKNKYDSLFDTLNEQPVFAGKIVKRNKNLFFSNISFLAPLTGNEIINILSDTGFNYISKIREQPVLSSQRCIPEVNLGAINLLAPLTGEKVGLIDSGIYNTTIRRLRTHHHNYLENHHTKDEHHGTTVASRILFGDNFFVQLTAGSSIAPACTILDVQVLYLNGMHSLCIPLEDLKEAIAEVVTRHTDVTIYNLSISENGPIDEDDVSELTEFLDNMAREHDVIFVCSVGNQQVYATQSYGNIFKQKEAVIASPSDALNIISVGSVSNKVGPDCINVDQGFPSPFSRAAGTGKGIKKPELVANGGNVKKDATLAYGDAHMVASSKVFGVESINKDGLNKDIGTSLSAPLVTRECAFLLDFIRKAKASDFIDLDHNKLNLVKALLIHSTAKATQAEIDNEHVKRAYGFGVPDHNAVLKDGENELTLMYTDKVNFVDKKHKLEIQLPESILGKPAEFIFTLVYNPPVDKNFSKEYKMMDIEPNVRFLIPSLDENGEVEEKPKVAGLISTPTWDHYRNPNHNVIHFRKIKRKVPSTVLEVLLQLSATQAYESKIVGDGSSENQPYAFILTVRDLSGLEHFRQEIIAKNEFEELIQVEAEEQVTT